MTIAASFEIRFTRYLLPDGREAADLPSFAADPRALVPDYRAMVFMRALDAKAVAMQRTGQIGTYASTLGKEAVDAGIGRVLRKEDVLLPSYRESGVLMLRGVSPHRTLLYWGGDERGNVFPESPRDFPYNVPIGTQLPHAAGVACEQCDGNDLIAVRDTVGRAVEKARTGGGPTLVEAVTYRLSDHTTADDATRYRSAEEVKEQWKAEPILRLRTWLHAKGV